MVSAPASGSGRRPPRPSELLTSWSAGLQPAFNARPHKADKMSALRASRRARRDRASVFLTARTE
jgi:hypothetical protein